MQCPLAHWSSKLLAFTRDLTALATFLSLVTFLQHSVPPVLHSSKTRPKYFNSYTCSNCVPSARISHTNPFSPHNNITLFISTLIFIHLLLHTSIKRHTITFSSSSERSHLNTRGQAISTLSPPLKISLLFFTPPFSLPSLLHPYLHGTVMCHTIINPERLVLIPFYSYTG